MDIPKEVTHEIMLNSDNKNRLKWKQREEFMEYRIGGLDIWDKHGYRVRCKVL